MHAILEHLLVTQAMLSRFLTGSPIDPPTRAALERRLEALRRSIPLVPPELDRERLIVLRRLQDLSDAIFSYLANEGHAATIETVCQDLMEEVSEIGEERVS